MCFPAEARYLFYSSDQYVSKDLDLINTNFAKRREIKSVMVVTSRNVDLKEIKRWSKAEGKDREFEIFAAKLK